MGEDQAAGSPTVAILSTGHEVGDARLHRLAASLIEAGMQVHLVALASAAEPPAGLTSVETMPRLSLPRRVARGWSLVSGRKEETLLVVDPELMPPAALIGRLRGKLVVCDVHEDYRAVLEDREWSEGWRRGAGRLVTELALVSARNADLTLVADQHIPPVSVRHERLVVRNQPRLADMPDPAAPAEAPRAVYVGDLRASRGSGWMVSSVAASSAWELDLIGTDASGSIHEALGPVPPEGRTRIRYHGRLASPEAWSRANGAWIGFCLLDDTPAFRQALASKIYEYLALGIVPVVSPVARQAVFVRENALGVVVSSPAELSQRLDAWREDRSELSELRAAGLAWARANLSGRTGFERAALAVRALGER